MYKLLLFFCVLFTVSISYSQVDDDDEVIQISPISKVEKVSEKIVKKSSNKDEKAVSIVVAYLEAITDDISIQDINRLRAVYKTNMFADGIDVGEANNVNFSMVWSYYDPSAMLLEVLMDGETMSSTYINKGRTSSSAQGQNWIAGPEIFDYSSIMTESVILDYNFITNPEAILKYNGTETIDGLNCHVVEVPNASSYKMQVEGEMVTGKEIMIHYYRKDNGLLYQSKRLIYQNSEANSESAEATSEVVSLYTNYQLVNGLLYPHTMNYTMEVETGVISMQSELRGLQVNPQLEEVKI